MRVPDPNILVVRRPLPVREGWDLDHHVTACSEGARACWGGGGVLGLLSVRPHFCWGGVGAAKGLLPYFLVPKGNQPTACTLALWWLKFGPHGGGGGLLGHDATPPPPPPRPQPLEPRGGSSQAHDWAVGAWGLAGGPPRGGGGGHRVLGPVERLPCTVTHCRTRNVMNHEDPSPTLPCVPVSCGGYGRPASWDCPTPPRRLSAAGRDCERTELFARVPGSRPPNSRAIHPSSHPPPPSLPPKSRPLALP